MSNDNQPKFTDRSDFALWDRYEKVAMHFNELIIRLRTQALGALAGVVAISGLAVNFAQKAESRSQWVILLGALLFFTFAWVALWILDIFYYHPLLEGAVQAILEVERVTQNGSHEAPIRLSTKIDAVVPNRIITFTWFYGLVLVGLLVGVGYTGWQVHTWEAPKHDIPEYKIQLVRPENMKQAVGPQKPHADQK